MKYVSNKKRICTGISCLVLTVCLLLTAASPRKVQAQDLDLYARSALLMDAENGRVLYEENGYQIMPMASTTKIMTCLLALEFMEKNQTTVNEIPVEVSAKAASMPKVHLGMKKGEKYLLRDLLYSLMLESHNDTAVAVAEYIAGSVENFADLMNNRAKELGCQNTCFLTPNGLDAEKDGRVHATTAFDLAKIASYAIQNDAFLEIIAARDYSFVELTGGRAFLVHNRDRFLDMMEGAIGIKTGFTGNAGYCFVGALKIDGKTLVSVVLGSGWPPNKSWKWTDTTRLMQYGLDHYRRRCIKKKFTYKPQRVMEGIEENVALYIEDKDWEKELGLLLCEEDTYTVKLELADELRAPIHRNDVIGYEKYYINGKLYKIYEILAAETVELRTYCYCLRQIFMLYFIGM